LDVIEDLLKKEKGNYHVLLRIFGILNEKEYEEAKRKIDELRKYFEKWEQSLTQM
jgi:predicted CopG family antitoxin